jgi:hypothetical protein
LYERYWSDDLLAALAAKSLARLHGITASIAEHQFLLDLAPTPPDSSPQDTYNR